jgi:hypothetical protein
MDRPGSSSGGPSGGSSTTKRFVLKPYKASLSISQHEAVELWLRLQGALHRIYAQEASQLSFEELYRCVPGGRASRKQVGGPFAARPKGEGLALSLAGGQP